jgi:hypothetical protein
MPFFPVFPAAYPNDTEHDREPAAACHAQLQIATLVFVSSRQRNHLLIPLRSIHDHTVRKIKRMPALYAEVVQQTAGPGKRTKG